jgi:hypothetical protein
MAKQHKAIQTQGKRASTPAQIATNTSGTIGGISNTRSSTVDASIREKGGDNQDYDVIKVPPARPSDDGDWKKIPITTGHIMGAWKLIIPFLTVLAIGLLWLAQLSYKVNQHDDDIKEVKVKTDKLVKESASESATLQKLDSQVGKLEDKIFQQAMERSKK